MSISYERHRFSAEIISYCGCPYYMFSLSYRDIEEMMLCCDINAAYEAMMRVLQVRPGLCQQTRLPMSKTSG